MSERRELSLEELKLGEDSFPRCVTYHSQAHSIVSISIYPEDAVPDLKKHMVKSNCRLEIMPDATEIVEVDLPMDKSRFMREFDTAEKMHALLGLLKEVSHSHHRHRRIQANIIPHDQPDLNTQVVMPKQSMRDAEAQYVTDRLLANQSYLSAWIDSALSTSGTILTKQPRIGLCTSGAIAARCLTHQLQREAFLPSVTHFASLSGSTWFVTDWLRNGAIMPGQERDRWNQDISNMDYLDGLYRIWLRRNSPEEEISDALLVENWTNALGYAYFGMQWSEGRLNYRLSEIAPDCAQHPYVIMTSLGKNKDAPGDEWDYYEYTPSHVSRIGSTCAIKTMSFGNKIDKAGIKTHNDVCSDELGQLMAVWGSAMCAEKRTVSQMIQSTYGTLTRIIFDEIFRASTDASIVFKPFEVPNWDPEHLDQFLRDGGFFCNIPIVSLLQPERGLDLIIVLDSSEDAFDRPAQNLVWAHAWAMQHGVPFPDIPPLDDIAAWRTAQLFEGRDGAPSILFLPLALNPVVPTFSLHYTPEQRYAASQPAR